MRMMELDLELGYIVTRVRELYKDYTKNGVWTCPRAHKLHDAMNDHFLVVHKIRQEEAASSWFFNQTLSDEKNGNNYTAPNQQAGEVQP